jgi:hypothetical protein
LSHAWCAAGSAAGVRTTGGPGVSSPDSGSVYHNIHYAHSQPGRASGRKTYVSGGSCW